MATVPILYVPYNYNLLKKKRKLFLNNYIHLYVTWPCEAKTYANSIISLKFQYGEYTDTHKTQTEYQTIFIIYGSKENLKISRK